MQDHQNIQINTQRIPVGSSIGAALLIAILLVGLFLDLPGVRGTAIGGGTIGLLLAVVLIWWRRRKVGNQPDQTLGISARPVRRSSAQRVLMISIVAGSWSVWPIMVA